MENDDWRTRLEQGIKAQNKTLRSVSLAANMGPGYVHSLLKENKDPTIDNFLKVCAAADLSAYTVLTGVKMTPETEQLMFLIEQMSERGRTNLVEFLREQLSHELSSGQPDDDNPEAEPTALRSPSMSP